MLARPAYRIVRDFQCGLYAHLGVVKKKKKNEEERQMLVGKCSIVGPNEITVMSVVVPLSTGASQSVRKKQR